MQEPRAEPDPESVDQDDEEPLYDENAFGLWLSWFDAEDTEYSQSADKFPPRIIVFRSAVVDFLESFPPGESASALELGTSIYIELADGDQSEDPVTWLRSFRAFLAQGDWRTFAAITHGGRWVTRKPASRIPSRVGNVTILATFGPSEPFRKAMSAETMAHDNEETGEKGWGAGLFVDADVLEALGRKLKNQPTPLLCAGGCFYRIGA